MDKKADLISIALWATVRLHNNQQKKYVYEELLKNIGDNHEYSKFIHDCLIEVELLEVMKK